MHKTRPDVTTGPVMEAMLARRGWTLVSQTEHIGAYYKNATGKLGLYLLWGSDVVDGRDKHWMSAHVYWVDDPGAFTMITMLHDNTNDLESMLVATDSYIDVCLALEYRAKVLSP